MGRSERAVKSHNEEHLDFPSKTKTGSNKPVSEYLSTHLRHSSKRPFFFKDKPLKYTQNNAIVLTA